MNMKQIDGKTETANAKQLYNNPSDSKMKPSESAIDRRRRVLVAMWKRMRQYCGQSWTREYGDVNGETINAWMDALGIFTEDQIARGVKSCQDWTKDFPPTLGQFKKLCLTIRHEEKPNLTDQRIAREESAGKPDSMIEHLSRHATTPVAQRELARMKRIMAGEEVETKEESYRVLELQRRWGPMG